MFSKGIFETIKGRDDSENVIFFKYTGERVLDAKKEEFLDNVNPIIGDDPYSDAYAVRDKNIEKDLELK